MTPMPKPRLPYTHREVARGRTFWYYRRGHGPRVRLSGDYGLPSSSGLTAPLILGLRLLLWRAEEDILSANSGPSTAPPPLGTSFRRRRRSSATT